MKRIIFFLAVFLCAFVNSGYAAALSGSWRGELTVGQYKLPLVFNFSENQSGDMTCTLDSPSQGAKGIQTAVTKCTADSIVVECKSIGAIYSAVVKGNMITGTFSQRGYSMPLALTPDEPMEERRPQTPRAPYPYTAIDTTFNAADGVQLSGTLVLPLQANSGKVPVVVMITGSGPQNRDEEIADHKPFAVIADYLGRNGIASFRYDDRGTAASKGNFLTSTTVTFKDDASCAIDFVRAMPCFGSVGVLGHSEGGTIAFMLGSGRKLDFVISLAGMAVSGKETLMMQNAHLLDVAGIEGVDKENSLQLISQVFDEMACQSMSNEKTPIDVDALVAKSGLKVPDIVLNSIKTTQRIRTSWLDAFVALNPTESLAKIDCPVLAINGDKDSQVDALSNLDVIKANVKNVDIRLMPGLNHLLQHATTGEVSEYSEIRETISPEVLEIILSFVNKN